MSWIKLNTYLDGIKLVAVLFTQGFVKVWKGYELFYVVLLSVGSDLLRFKDAHWDTNYKGCCVLNWIECLYVIWTASLANGWKLMLMQ
jgi:hypothetical protein